MRLRKKNPATVVAKSATSPVTAITLPPTLLVQEPEWLPAPQLPAPTPVAVAAAAKSVTNAASLAILLVSALKVVEEAGTAVAGIRAKAAMAVEAALVAEPEGAKARLAILAAAMVTCLVIALKGRNATTVSF